MSANTRMETRRPHGASYHKEVSLQDMRLSRCSAPARTGTHFEAADFTLWSCVDL